MDRSTGTPLGFALLLLFAFAFGWVVYDGHGDHDGLALASSSTRFAQNQATLDWPNDMPGPLTAYTGRQIRAMGLKVTGVDADEGFWVEKNGQRAWIELLTTNDRPPGESPYTVRVGDTVTLFGTVQRHDPNFPSQIYFCIGRDISARELSSAGVHLAVGVEALSFGTG